MKKALHDHARLVRGDIAQDEIFRESIKRVERHGKKKNVFHVDVMSFRPKRSRVEESLTIYPVIRSVHKQ